MTECCGPEPQEEQPEETYPRFSPAKSPAKSPANETMQGQLPIPATMPPEQDHFQSGQNRPLLDPETHLNKNATFDTFVPGDSNRFARTVALAVAEVESNFDMEAVGAVGEVGVMQLNPGPENTYWINLQAETNQDPTTPAGNIVCGVYLLGTHLVNYGDTEKALMAYNMGPAGALQAWEDGITSTE